MSGSYDFCVIRLTDSANSRGGEERMHARFKFGDINPGREVARLIVFQRFRQANTTSMQVVDYSENDCACNVVSEFNVSASPEQLAKLASEIGSGDLTGAAITAADIAAGGIVSIVKASGGVLQKLGKLIGRIFG